MGDIAFNSAFMEELIADMKGLKSEIETNFCEATIKYFEHVMNTAMAED